MRHKPKTVAPRLGPPPQFLSGMNLHQNVMCKSLPGMSMKKKLPPPVYFQAHDSSEKFSFVKLVKNFWKSLSLWYNENFLWRNVLMGFMVLIVASKMGLLMFTYQFFSLTAIISLLVYHGVWTIAFFCLNMIDKTTTMDLPNTSCLLAGYLPATTVLHVLLFPNNYPMQFVIADAATTFLAIIIMFVLLRMECSEILTETAAQRWNHPGFETISQSSGTCSTTSGGGYTPSTVILGPPTHEAAASVLDSFIFASLDQYQNCAQNENMARRYRIDEEAVDLEPIDFEHFEEDPYINCR